MSTALSLSPRRIRPCVVLDLETTGLLCKVDKPGPWGNARIIEVGAVTLAADLTLDAPRAMLVWQPEAHLRSYEARRAQRVSHKIQPEWVLEYGRPEQDAADAFANYLTGQKSKHSPDEPLELRGWNQGFEKRMLRRDCWGPMLANLQAQGVVTWGEDCMTTASRWLRHERCLKTLDDQKIGGSIKLEVLAAFLGVKYSNHRALGDARLTADVIIHILHWRAQNRARLARMDPEERNRRACERRNAAALAAAKRRRSKKAPRLEPEERLVLRVRTEDGELLERRVTRRPSELDGLAHRVAERARTVAADCRKLAQYLPINWGGKTIRVVEVLDRQEVMALAPADVSVPSLFGEDELELLAARAA